MSDKYTQHLQVRASRLENENQRLRAENQIMTVVTAALLFGVSVALVIGALLTMIGGGA